MRLYDLSYSKRKDVDLEIARFEERIVREKQKYVPMNFNLLAMVGLPFNF